jgi:predicted nuclease of predicted toxin-antitoxin system
VKFLVDLNLSPHFARRLLEADQDAVHCADLELFTATDERILAVARDEVRVVVSADADFGTILARTRASSPSLILVRRTQGRRVEQLVDLVVANLPAVEDDLVAGSIVVLGESTVRIRRLPIL